MYNDDLIFTIGPIFIALIFIIVIGTILYNIFTAAKQGVKNGQSPVLTVPAKVVSKRIDVQGNHSYTTYYATFEVTSGDRMEFVIKGKEHGMLIEQDLGLLTFQGTRYIEFERQK